MHLYSPFFLLGSIFLSCLAFTNVVQGFLQHFITILSKWIAMTKINRIYVFPAYVFQGLYKTRFIVTSRGMDDQGCIPGK